MLSQHLTSKFGHLLDAREFYGSIKADGQQNAEACCYETQPTLTTVPYAIDCSVALMTVQRCNIARIATAGIAGITAPAAAIHQNLQIRKSKIYFVQNSQDIGTKTRADCNGHIYCGFAGFKLMRSCKILLR